ncbi:MAG: hypothetical protein JXR03_21205 [Cyclobacteriaceae bacterium]
MSQKTIEFYKIRDFGEKFNATIEFIRYNFSSLIKICFLIAAPIGLLFGILMSSFFKSIFSMGTEAQQGQISDAEAIGYAGTMGVSFLIMMLLSVVSIALVTSAINIYMRILNETGKSAPISEIYAAAFKKLFGVVGLMILTYLFSTIGMIFFIFPGIYLFITLTLSVPCYLFEDISFGEALSRPFKLIKEKWWSTFGLLFIAMMIASFSSYIFAIPYYVVVFAEMFTNIEQGGDPNAIMEIYTNWKTSASMGLMIIGSYLTYMVPIIALSFQYFNLKERLDGTGLKSQIENFENLG